MAGLASTELLKSSFSSGDIPHEDFSGEKALGILCTFVATLVFSCVYIGAEHVLNKSSTKPSERQVCYLMGGYGTALLLLYILFYTLPNWDHLVDAAVSKNGGNYSQAFGVLGLLVLFSLLQHLAYFYLLKNAGAVTTGVIQALRAVCVFVTSSVLYCSSDPSQCISAPKGFATIIVATGVLLYSFGANKKKVQTTNSQLVDIKPQKYYQERSCHTTLLERDESRRVSSTNTGATVAHGFVRKGELSKVVTNHIGLDLNSVEYLSVVNANDRSDHFRNNDHVAKMGLHSLRLLVLGGVLLGNAELLDKCGILPVQTPSETPPLTSTDEVEKLLIGHIKESIELNSTEVELSEGSPLRGSGRHVLSFSQKATSAKAG
eukprot:CAMPEP_0113912006 /NCGR_PEP_ID=MMETSP0780_2-20120614/28618_1 /TAXON_ID=652834 /ORGANISM="Palpitomonas bilix" /LENGTH=375 /DNA_ID=CAMNT_0000908779 /DNA_START=413 /DNA_END=1538 /DNA_ORIENTATION=+ /assembly_acc=CAM_ASM_000599